MIFIDKFNKWRYLGYSKEILKKCENAIDKNNMKVLKSASILGVIIWTITAIFYSIIQKHTHSTISLFYGLLSLIVFLISSKVYKFSKRYSTNVKNGLIMVCAIITYSFGIFIGTFGAGNDLAVTVVWQFIFISIIFDMIPMKNLIMIPTAIIFIFCSYITKDNIKASYDLINVTTAIIIGLYMSWYKTRLRVESIINKFKLKEKNKKLYYLNTIDSLTGLLNRKEIFKILCSLHEECIKDDEKLVCLMMDVDNFKAYNDFYGHPYGDKLLHQLGKVFNDLCETNEIYIGRIGGEEFLACWKLKENEDPQNMANKIRKSVIALNIPHVKSDASKVVTISQGLFVDTDNKIEKYETAYILADEALYQAKNRGKNCCYRR